MQKTQTPKAMAELVIKNLEKVNIYKNVQLLDIEDRQKFLKTLALLEFNEL